MAKQSNEDKNPGQSMLDIAKEFLRLVFVAYGGPAAYIAMMEERFVASENG